MAAQKLRWQCIRGCGACCRLAPQERVEALQALSKEQTIQYLRLVADDGWCRFYNKSLKTCTIYNQRPDFCNVKNLLSIFKLDNTPIDTVAIMSCRQHIRSIYGGRCQVLKRFEHTLRSNSS